MYLEHFGLSRFPFTIAPDPDFLFRSTGHQEALAHLHYTLTGHGGLVCLTGEVGTGKTTLCRVFLDSTPDHIRTAYLFNPHLSALELLQSLCDELGIEHQDDDSQKVLYARINEALLEWYSQGQRVICVVDEAQAMPAPLLEQIRLLTNLETSKEKLLTLILVGQPELREVLARHELRQLNQRITARYHLSHLSETETRAYLKHRLNLAGCDLPVFGTSVARDIWRKTNGVPRLINSVADRCLLGAYASNSVEVTSAIARQAIVEVLGEPAGVKPSGAAHAPQPLSRVPAWGQVAGIGLVAVLGVALGLSLTGTLNINGLQANKPAAVASVEAQAAVESAPAQASAAVTANDNNTAGEAVAGAAQQAGNVPQQVQPVYQGDPAVLALSRLTGLAAKECDDLRSQGWDCLRVNWPDSQLRPLAGQAVVEMRSGEWVSFAQSQNAPRTGQTLVAWQPPRGYRGLVKPGSRSDVVPMVRRQLGVEWHGNWQVIGPASNTMKSDERFYDPLLAIEVAKFQASHGLAADRIIGPQTLLYLQLKAANLAGGEG